MPRGTKKSSTLCRTCEFPDIPAPWLLFIEFALTFGTTIVYFADIVTDAITLKVYFDNGWHWAFVFSLVFIVLPSILLAVFEFQFLRKTYGKSFSWKAIILRTVLNIPFQLTVIWYHLRLSYTFFCNWVDHIRGLKQSKKTPAQWYSPTTLERSRGASLSSLNELDYYQRSAAEEDSHIHGSEVVHAPLAANLSLSMGSLAGLEEGKKEPENWWQRLTREQWLSHLNKLKLSESMLESLPQLLINLYLICYYKDTSAIQYISAILSYLSLCGGVVRYDKTRKDNEADQWMVDRTLIHSRAFHTRLEWPQILFIALYKGSFLAARILAIVFFTLFFSWYILIPIMLHWGVILCYFVYRWYPDFNKVTKQLQQADYKYRAYIFLSHDFLSVFHASLMAIFIHVRPYYHAFLDQPYCFMFWYYIIYITENIALFLIPGIYYSLRDENALLYSYQYYILLATDLFLNIAGSLLCTVYYLAVHKMRAFTAHAYPTASKILCACCRSDDVGIEDEGYWLPMQPDWTVCKQAETSEIFFLTKEQLKSFHKTYSTVVRKDRLTGRAVECFIDDHCKIFYAPRSKMKKIKIKGYNMETLPRPSLRRLNDSARSRTEVIEEETDGLIPENNPQQSEAAPKVASNQNAMSSEAEVENGLGSQKSLEGDYRPVPRPRSTSPFKKKNIVSDQLPETASPPLLPVQGPVGQTPVRKPRKHESIKSSSKEAPPRAVKPTDAISEVESTHKRQSLNESRNRRETSNRDTRSSSRKGRHLDTESELRKFVERGDPEGRSSSRSTDREKSSSRKPSSQSITKKNSRSRHEPSSHNVRSGKPFAKSHSSRSHDGASRQLSQEHKGILNEARPHPSNENDITNEHPGWQQTWI